MDKVLQGVANTPKKGSIGFWFANSTVNYTETNYENANPAASADVLGMLFRPGTIETVLVHQRPNVYIAGSTHRLRLPTGDARVTR